MKKYNKLVSILLAGVLMLPLVPHSVWATPVSGGTTANSVDYIGVDNSGTSVDDIRLNYRDVDIQVESVHSGIDRNYAENLPVSYTTDNLPAVRNQNPHGTCWAFASTALAELSIYKHESRPLDLSESHLAYFTYQGVEDPLGLIANDINRGGTEKAFYELGGNLLYSMQAYANWKGAALESKYPYGEIEGLNTSNMTKEDAFNDVAHLRNAYMINRNDVQDVKKMIMEYGAVGISYYEDYTSYNETYNSYYQTAFKGSTNHAVTIVGWDDNFPAANFSTAARGNGAWLIRNSWGEDEDSHFGYFWISYYEPSLADVVYVFDFVSNNSAAYYDNNYQYDGGIASRYYGYQDCNASFANVFTTQNELEELKAVSIGAAQTNMSYKIEIYKDLTDRKNPASGTLVSTTQGETTYEGIYTIELEDSVLLPKDTVYSVVVNIEKDGNLVALFFETDCNSWIVSDVNCNSGESFVRAGDNAWEDFGDNHGGNLRIKAFTNNVICTHNYSTEWVTDGTNHWHVCELCGTKKDVTAHSGGTATCTKPAQCTMCGESYGTTNTTNHKAGSAVRENETAATCTSPASYDEVIYCVNCRKELSRTHKTAGSALGHQKQEVAQKEATCTERGNIHYWACSRCKNYYKDEACTSQVTASQLVIPIDRSNHKAGSAVRENEAAATYTSPASYDEVIYCVNCHKELSRTTKTEGSALQPAESPEGQFWAEYQGNSFYQENNGDIRCYDNQGNPVINDFKCDGIYTYYFQADGTAMKNRLTYHPDGEHVIYFNEKGHEVFNNYAHVKQSIAGDAVDDYCYFDGNGYLYVNVLTWDEPGNELLYANPCGVLERTGWFQFSDSVKWADGTPCDGIAGQWGYGQADGTLLRNQWFCDSYGSWYYMQGNGVALY